MKLTNQTIYNYALALNAAFNDTTQKLPIKINFYLIKNKNILMSLGQNIEDARLAIIQENGTPNEDGTQYIIPQDKVEVVQKELDDLFSLEQEVQIYTIKADVLSDDLMLTTAQMEALMFMIE
jgi:hypothetical protein